MKFDSTAAPDSGTPVHSPHPTTAAAHQKPTSITPRSGVVVADPQVSAAPDTVLAGAAIAGTEATARDDDEPALTTDHVRVALRRVKDPDLNLNIVDLGLIYDIAVDGGAVKIDMSLTSPGCPSGPEIMGNAEQQVRTVPGVTDVTVNLVWAPYWTPDRIEPRVRAYLGF